MRGGLDRSLRHWRRFRARLRAPRTCRLAGAANVVAGPAVRRGYGAVTVPDHAASLWSWCRRFEITEPYRCQAENPHEPRRVRARALCNRSRRQPPELTAQMAIPYYHVDSFATALFVGNPAGVCILPTFPADAVMQQIAQENRHPITAFVVKRDDGDFNLRWFAPQTEVDLCGHATLAAAYVLALRSHDSWPVRFHTQSGLLTVARDGEAFEMDFPAWTLQASDPPEGLLPALGLPSAEVLKSSRDYMVVVDRAEQVRDLSPDIRAIGKLDIGFSGIIVTAAGRGNVDYVVRFFAPSMGIDEDFVTGSINCALAPYWSHRLGKRVLQVKQLSPRGGELRCTVAGNRVRVAGAARLYLHGVLEL